MLGLASAGQRAFIGASRTADGKGFKWDDGTPWTTMADGNPYKSVEVGEDWDDPSETHLYLIVVSDTAGEYYVEWRGTNNVKGVICQADMANIKGAIPTIVNLARVAPPKREACSLSREHVDAIKSVSKAFMTRNESCVYNQTVSEIMHG
eukprot:COSAG05_NODE_5685_length_1116_cov_0.907571_1_plen_150_part_00